MMRLDKRDMSVARKFAEPKNTVNLKFASAGYTDYQLPRSSYVLFFN